MHLLVENLMGNVRVYVIPHIAPPHSTLYTVNRSIQAVFGIRSAYASLHLISVIFFLIQFLLNFMMQSRRRIISSFYYRIVFVHSTMRTDKQLQLSIFIIDATREVASYPFFNKILFVHYMDYHYLLIFPVYLVDLQCYCAVLHVRHTEPG